MSKCQAVQMPPLKHCGLTIKNISSQSKSHTKGAPARTYRTYRYPYEASIQTKIFNYEYKCGAAIISPTWIITAAHCVGLTLLVSRVVAGVDNLQLVNNATAQIRFIDIYNVIQHPQYKDEILNDIALIKVTEPFDFNDYVQPLPISKESCVSTDEIYLFSGWETKDQTLHSVNVTILPFQECYNHLHPLYGDNLILNKDMHLCVVGEGDSCVHNDGGPLTHDGRLVGLLSWLLSSCTNDKTPTVFTNIGYFTKFIKEHVDDLPIFY